MNIQELISYIAKRYQFTPEKYPEIKDMTEEEKLSFAIRHLSIHFSKTAGKVATVSEARDHGGEIDFESLKVDVAKSLLNTLRLAELVKVSSDELESMIKAYVK